MYQYLGKLRRKVRNSKLLALASHGLIWGRIKIIRLCLTTQKVYKWRMTLHEASSFPRLSCTKNINSFDLKTVFSTKVGTYFSSVFQLANTRFQIDFFILETWRSTHFIRKSEFSIIGEKRDDTKYNRCVTTFVEFLGDVVTRQSCILQDVEMLFRIR